MSDVQTSADGNETRENRTIIYVWKIPVDRAFVFSIHSFLVVAAIILSLVALICVASARTEKCDDSYSSSYNYFEFVSISAFTTLFICWLFYALTLSSRLFFIRIPWILIDLIYNIIFVIFYLIANIVVAAQTCGKDSNAAGSVFGFLAMFCMAGSAFFQFRQLQIQMKDKKQDVSTTTEQNKEQY